MVDLSTSRQETPQKLTPVELESFADESKRVCLLQVMKKRQLTLQTFEYEARELIKDDLYKEFFILK